MKTICGYGGHFLQGLHEPVVALGSCFLSDKLASKSLWGFCAASVRAEQALTPFLPCGLVGCWFCCPLVLSGVDSSLHTQKHIFSWCAWGPELLSRAAIVPKVGHGPKISQAPPGGPGVQRWEDLGKELVSLLRGLAQLGVYFPFLGAVPSLGGG